MATGSRYFGLKWSSRRVSAQRTKKSAAKLLLFPDLCEDNLSVFSGQLGCFLIF